MSTDEKKAYLQQYAELNREVQRQAEELMRMRSLAEKCTPVWSDTPKGCPEGGSLETSVERIVELEQELNARIDAMITLRREIDKAIQTVPDSSLQLLLRYRYLDGMKWEAVADKIGYERSWVTRLHKRALNELALESTYKPMI